MTIEDRKNRMQQSSGEVTPDSLMKHFRGRGLKSIIMFTLVVHVVVLGGSSVPFLWKSVFGPDTAAMDKEERLEHAMRKATASMRDIAKEYDLRPQEISDQFGTGGATTGGARKAAATEGSEASGESEATESATESADSEPDKPKSAMEKKLEETKEGPEMPAMNDDIF